MTDQAICEGCGAEQDLATCSICGSTICRTCATTWGTASGVNHPTCDCGRAWGTPIYTFLSKIEMTDNDGYGWTKREDAADILKTMNENAADAGAYEATIDPDLWVTVYQSAGGHEVDLDIYGPFFTEAGAIAKAKELTADYDEKADDDGLVYGFGYSTEVQKLDVPQ